MQKQAISGQVYRSRILLGKCAEQGIAVQVRRSRLLLGKYAETGYC